jgi:hypothetical protein
MPEDGVVQIAFDRYLLPRSVTRQSVNIYGADGKPLAVDQAPNVLYDPVARAVTLTRPALDRPWLTPGVPYKLHFSIPKDETDISGLRAIDGATVDPNQPLDYSFFVAPAQGAARSLAQTLGEPESVSFCQDVLPIFASKCSGSKCHSASGAAAASLVLETSDGVRTTALNRLAQGSNVGGLSGTPRAEGTQFGVDMPIIAVDLGPSPPVGSPGNSWLMYKIDLAETPANPGARSPYACAGGADRTAKQATDFLPLSPVLTTGSPSERSILSDLVLGREMPYPVLEPTAYDERPLTFQERETVRMWIARGAETPDCGVCGFR